MIFEPFKTGNVYKMRHGKVWATFLMSDQLFYSLEHDALTQIRNTMELPGVKSLTITPDAHTGYGFAIGSVVESETHLYPDVVGPDPACSVALSKLGRDNMSKWSGRRDLLEKMGERIGVGRGLSDWKISMETFKLIIRGEMRPAKSWINSYPALWQESSTEEYKSLVKLLESKMTDAMLHQVATIGGGNHFVEIQEAENGENYLMTHFGSRGIGAAMAKWFDEAIAEELKKWNGTPMNGLLFVPADSLIGRMYYMFQLAMLEWASYNHHVIHQIVFEEIGGEYLGHIPHNFIEKRNGKYVGRKGATPAYEFDGIPLLIPGSMATGSYVLRPGVKSEKLGESVSHGAGRVLSRGKAKEQLDQELVNMEFEDAGVIGNFENVPLDESHGAYKDVDEVIQSLVDAEVAEVEMRLRPVMVLKGT
jgi:tRNA-splicing ligase RtcB (3'-phosphate/5'-hydroxy nucleic acid ligase)